MNNIAFLPAVNHAAHGRKDFDVTSFLNLVARRQSTRAYSNRPVEREKLQRCLEAARIAPSACNSQPWHFILVDTPDLARAVARSTFGKLVSINHFSQQAPVLAIVVAEAPTLMARLGGLIRGIPFYLIDIGIAAQHFCLQAEEEGLGSCMLGWVKARGIKKLLHIPRSKQIILAITLGYPQTDEIREKKRKPVELMSSFNEYSKG
jgi:nitroreductase